MTSIQIKEEIKKALDHVPETALTEVLNFVRGIQTPTSEQTKLENNLTKIINEDKGLLERLAQ